MSRELFLLVAPGSYCPVHTGHIEMLIAARKHLEQVYNASTPSILIRGVFVVSPDSWVQEKLSSSTSSLIPIAHRIKLIQSVCAELHHDDNWLDAIPWPGVSHDPDAPYPTHKPEFTAEMFPSHPNITKLIVVVGDDNIAFVNRSQHHCVVVLRTDTEVSETRAKCIHPERVYFVVMKGRDHMSSTNIRRILQSSSSIMMEDGVMEHLGLHRCVLEYLSQQN
eukprot:PhF_6_TR5742/c0_g1_i1/m.8466/K06210/NMNAT; nicotinamide mononucleotide adenylyltransferase